MDIDKYVEGLLDKAREAYLLALEIINKPTINYRTEGFCFFMCNAWELVLKAYLIKKENDINVINFKGKDNRTIGLDICVERVFPSTTDYTKSNIHALRELRNKATHLVLAEYDYTFSGLFQRSMTNFNKFMDKQFENYKMNNDITPFISINSQNVKYDSPLLINQQAKETYEKLMGNVLGNDEIHEYLHITSLNLTSVKKGGDFTFSVDKSSDKKVQMVAVPKDVNLLYPLTFAETVKRIQDSVTLAMGNNHGFTTNTFHKICAIKKIKENPEYCYTFNYSGGVKKYSEKAVEYISYLYISDEDLMKRTCSQSKLASLIP